MCALVVQVAFWLLGCVLGALVYPLEARVPRWVALQVCLTA